MPINLFDRDSETETNGCLAIAMAIKVAADQGCSVSRIGTHRVSPDYIRVWVRDADSPSGSRVLGLAPSVKNTRANRAMLRSLGVEV